MTPDEGERAGRHGDERAALGLDGCNRKREEERKGARRLSGSRVGERRDKEARRDGVGWGGGGEASRIVRALGAAIWDAMASPRPVLAEATYIPEALGLLVLLAGMEEDALLQVYARREGPLVPPRAQGGAGLERLTLFMHSP